MGSAADTINLSEILKDLWTQEDYEGLFYSDFPLYAKIDRSSDWVGDTRKIVVEWGQIGAPSNQFNAALYNRGPTSQSTMTISTADVFAIWSVDNKLIRLSRNDAGAVVRAVKSQTDSAMRSLKRKMNWQFYGNGGGAIGVIATAGISTTQITLATPNDARKFEKGYVIRSSTTDGTSGSLNTGSIVVSAVDRIGGVLTFTTNVTAGIPAAAAGDYLFIDGDFGAAFKGLPYYVPSTKALAVASTVWGMDRTPDPLRLGGVRIGGLGMETEEAIYYALRVASDQGANEVDTIMMNSRRWMDFSLSLEGRRIYRDERVGNIGFKGLEVMTQNGRSVVCYGDADCGLNDIWLLNTKDIKFVTAGGFPDFLTLDEKPIDEQTSNSGQFRSGGYGQVYLEHPGWHGRLMMDVSPTSTAL